MARKGNTKRRHKATEVRAFPIPSRIPVLYTGKFRACLLVAAVLAAFAVAAGRKTDIQ